MDKDRIRILIIEDDEDDYALVRTLLADIQHADFSLEWVQTYREGLRELSRSGYDACLLDYRLGPQNGLQLIRAAMAAGCDKPIILLTGHGDHGVDTEAMRSGAADYLVKSYLTTDMLDCSIRYAIARKNAEREIKNYHDRLEGLVEKRTKELKEANEKLRVEIAERSEMEAALRASEERTRDRASYLQATLDAAPAIIFVAHDSGCRRISLNRAARELCLLSEWTDMSREDFSPEHNTRYRLFKDGKELAFHEGPLQIAAKSGREQRDYSLEFVLEDGAEHSLLGNIVPVFDFEGKPDGAIAAFVDVTELKKAETACRESENRLTLAIQQAGMGTWDVDLRTGEAIWSQNHFQLLGYEPRPDGKAKWDMWKARIHPDDFDKVMEEIERAKREHSLYAPQYRIIRAGTGEVVWPTAYGRFLYDENGEAIRFTGIFFDSTRANGWKKSVKGCWCRCRSSRPLVRTVQRSRAVAAFGLGKRAAHHQTDLRGIRGIEGEQG